MSDASKPTRNHLALALDADSEPQALALAEQLQEYFAVAKVGYELWATAGPPVIAKLRKLGFEVFLDLKLHDIPTTVNKGARVLGRLGVAYLNFHASGGEAMLRSGHEGLMAGAEEAGCARPSSLGVTVLTSDQGDENALRTRTETVVQAGLDGVVCAASDIDLIRSIGPNLFTMVPGIRMPDSDKNDQTRVATPRDALTAGADLLVIGRTVTAATDPTAAAAALIDSL